MSMTRVLRKRSIFLLLAIVFSVGFAAPWMQAAQAQQYNKAYYELDALNEGLPIISPPPNLQTPQATLEYFVMAAAEKEFERAAAALNLNLIPVAEQTERAPELAAHLNYLLIRKSLINWGAVPDRPDGQIDPAPGGDNPLAGEPRRSIQLGAITVDGRDIEIRLQRVKVGSTSEANAIWVFSAQTVDNIPLLYERFGPTTLDRRMPEWAKIQLPGGLPLWEWLILAGLALVGVLVGWIVRNLVARGSMGEISAVRWFTAKMLRRDLQFKDNIWLRGISTIISGPLALVCGLVTFYILVQTVVSLSGTFASLFDTILVILIIISITWLGVRIVKFFSDYVGKQFTDDLGGDDQMQARKALTYISVARRVFVFLALLVGIGFALSQFRGFETFGMSLLASAGVISVIVGVAAQGVLGNIMAGVQVALTQPVRIGDNVYFEDQWGYIESITYTYITIQTWDQRRVIVPLKYFISTPVQNWSKHSSHLIRPIYLYVDYQTDVERIRQAFSEMLRNDEDWDEETDPTVQVTGMGDETIEVRALCSAKDPSTAWALHCRLREKLVVYVRDLESGRYLPRQRLVVEPGSTNGNQHHDGRKQDGTAEAKAHQRQQSDRHRGNADKQQKRRQPAGQNDGDAQLLHELLDQDADGES
jgi:small-conductance mechanosensitive channel